jgi:hypothetical protein
MFKFAILAVGEEAESNFDAPCPLHTPPSREGAEGANMMSGGGGEKGELLKPNL